MGAEPQPYYNQIRAINDHVIMRLQCTIILSQFLFCTNELSRNVIFYNCTVLHFGLRHGAIIYIYENLKKYCQKFHQQLYDFSCKKN